MTDLQSIGIWIGIGLCIVQSAFFSGLNLAVFNVSQLQLQIEADAGNADAARVLELRKNSNEVLATVIWGNVSINVLLTLLSNSVLAGVGAFLFSVVAITLLGEILPQAYFSRNALRVTTLLMPFLNLYRFVLYPLAKPTGLLLDWWLGKEGILYPGERHIRFLIARSAASWGDIGRLEAIGARNFLDLGEVLVTDEGEPVHSQSIISAPIADRGAVLPKFSCSPEIRFFGRSMRQARGGDFNRPGWRADFVWTHTTSSGMCFSISWKVIPVLIGTGRSSSGTCKPGWVRLLGG